MTVIFIGLFFTTVESEKQHTFKFLFSDKPCCIHEAPVTIAISETSTKNLVVCDTKAEPGVKIYRWELNTTAGIMQIENQRTPRLYLSKDQIRLVSKENRNELTFFAWS